MATSDKSLPPPGWGPRGLDLLLSVFPAGQLSEIVGPWSSGASSLLLALVARVTGSGGQAALVDWTDAFDPASAVAAGADLGKLLWVKCGRQLRAAFSAADLLARCPDFALVALDLGDLPPIKREPIPSAHYRRLKIAAEQGPTALVLRVPRSLAGSAAALLVSLDRAESRWIGHARPTRFAGLVCQAKILRSRAGSHAYGNRLEGTGVDIEWRL